MRDNSIAGGKAFRGEYARIQALLWMRVESKTLSVGRLLREKPTFPSRIREAVFNESWQAIRLKDRTDPTKIVGDGELHALRTLFAGLLATARQFPQVAPFFIRVGVQVLNAAWLEVRQALEILFDKEITVRLAALCKDTLDDLAKEKRKRKPTIADLKEEEKAFIIEYITKQVKKRFSGDLWIYQEEAATDLIGNITREIQQGRKIKKLPNYINHAITNKKNDTIREKHNALAKRVYDSQARRVFSREMMPTCMLPDTNDDEKEKEAIRKFEARRARLDHLMTEGLSKLEALLEIEIETRSDCLKEGKPIPDARWDGPGSFDERGAPIYKDGWLETIAAKRKAAFLNQGPSPYLDDIYDSHRSEPRLFLSNWIHSHFGNLPEERYARAEFLDYLSEERWVKINHSGRPAFIKKWGPIMQRIREGWTFDEIKNFWTLPPNHARMNQKDVDEAEAFIIRHIGIWANITNYDRKMWVKYRHLIKKLLCPVGARVKTQFSNEWPTKNSFYHRCLFSFTGKLFLRKGPRSDMEPEIEDGGGPTPEKSGVLVEAGRPRTFCPLCKDTEETCSKESVTEYLKHGGSLEVSPFSPIVTPTIDTGIYRRHVDLSYYQKNRLLI